jgi:hypothetical protein
MGCLLPLLLLNFKPDPGANVEAFLATVIEVLLLWFEADDGKFILDSFLETKSTGAKKTCLDFVAFVCLVDLFKTGFAW